MRSVISLFQVLFYFISDVGLIRLQIIVGLAGSLYEHVGDVADTLCLPHDPKDLQYQAGYQGGAYLRV